MITKTITLHLAEKVAAAGGRAYYVGGCVRDRLLGKQNKDIDIEVHGLTEEELLPILDSCGMWLAFGKSFGIYSLAGENVDVALPRREKAVGKGHRDFEVEVDPHIGPKDAAKRRDFTVNAMMEDILTGEVLDFYDGRVDLTEGVLRHVDDDSFGEDPLRVLRGAQFAARFEMELAPETIAICRHIDLTTLSQERVMEELKKALLEAEKPSIFFEVLREMNQLTDWFPETAAMIGVEQNPKFHPEGDVWTHTMLVLDKAAAYRRQVEHPLGFMLAALAHDFGKARTTETINGVIHAYKHELEGLVETEAFLNRLTSEKKLIEYVLNMVENHMRPNLLAEARSSIKSSNKMFDQSAEPEALICLAQADAMPGAEPSEPYLRERLAVYRQTMAQPYVMGKDLIEHGLEPGSDFTELLEFAHKLRLARIPKEEALKQTLGYARSRK